MSIVSQTIRLERIKAGLTRKELGLLLGYAKSSAGQTISKIENEKIGLPERKIAKLMSVFGITDIRVLYEPKNDGDHLEHYKGIIRDEINSGHGVYPDWDIIITAINDFKLADDTGEPDES